MANLKTRQEEVKNSKKNICGYLIVYTDQDVDTNKDFINIANYVRQIKGSLDLTMPAVIKYITDNKTEYKLQKEKIRGKKDKKATFWILTKE